MAQGNRPAAEPYTGKSVQIVGGGFVDGIVFHPTAKGVRYAPPTWAAHTAGTAGPDGGTRCWLGSLRRSQPAWAWRASRWTPLTRIACIWPCGTYTTQVRQRRHPAFEGSRPDVRAHQCALQIGGNEDGRGTAKRMSVDPTTATCSTWARASGSLENTDGAVTWRRVEVLPRSDRGAPGGRRGARAGRAAGAASWSQARAARTARGQCVPCRARATVW